VIGYIADFGYKYFEHLYSPNQISRKNAGLERVCSEFDTILMSSNSVLEDYKRFFPEATAKGSVLHFIPALTVINEKSADFESVRTRYGLPERYFYTPNQFWVHKNHGAIVKALALLVSEGIDVHIVSTGLPEDPRRPEYFPELMAEVRRLGLGDRFHVLGLVPYSDAKALMLHCVGVVSASLFEGWGLSIAEAILTGKTAILSDIAVFREQQPQHAYFFAPQSEQELALRLREAWENYSPAEDLKRQAAAKERQCDLLRDYALGYEEIVTETVDRKKYCSSR
jgi:glycosyltransferase involved in cell wall biosynthesis